MPKFYITTPIYYVNDEPHCGHAYTTIAADVLARSHRLKGDKVFFLTGTDEHGDKVAEIAKKCAKEPLDFCNEISEKFKEAWKSLNISNDFFIRTTSEKHQLGIEALLLKLKDNKDIYKKKYQGLYCAGCEKFILEKELVNGLCPDHKKEPKLIEEENYFFRLGKYLPTIKKLIEKDKIKILPKERKLEALGLLKQDLEDFSISRQRTTWGINVPWDKSQRVYVWVDALSNYISGIGYPNKEFKKWWPADLHIIGKDILKFHAIYWPAMLLAAKIEPPKSIFVHGFFTINGQKMSKSLGNTIRPDELIKKFGVDATRYLLLTQFPFGQDGDISWEKLTEKYNADLANGLGNLVQRTIGMITKYLGGRIPALKIKLKKKEKFEKFVEELKLEEALKEIWQIIALSDIYISEKKPWQLTKDNPKELNKVLGNLKNNLLEIASFLTPFMPSTAQTIMEIFSGANIKIIKPLFPRLAA